MALHARFGVVLRIYHTEYAFSLIQVNLLHIQQQQQNIYIYIFKLVLLKVEFSHKIMLEIKDTNFLI